MLLSVSQLSCVVLVMLSLASCVLCEDPFSYSKENCVMNTTLPFRLPLTVIPSHYHLDMWPALEAPYELNGTVTVNVDVMSDTTCIVLHQHELILSEVTFVSLQSNFSLSPIFIDLDDEKQFAILYFEDILSLGSALLRYSFHGYANTDPGGGKGFFVSTLELVPPGDSKMFATQFEGPYARSAFPCFDEPSLKATFQSRFVVYKPSYISDLDSLVVLFNTEEEAIFTDYSSQSREFQFAKTPVPISSYLVAFAIGELAYLETNSQDIRYRVYSSPGKEQYAQFSLNITVELIEFWSNVFDVKYPFSKLDQIAVPKIIEDGMENMGLVTYWPPWLLENGNYSTIGQEQQAAQVIAHELVHMWFGDMVTLPWWSEAYNNEGFARYLQYVGCQYLYPDWDVWESGSSSYFSFAYNYIVTDSVGTGRSLVVPPGTVSGTVDSVTNMFSGPTYPKGAAVNRMMNIYMGDDDWYGGLAYHLKKHLYGNPTSQQVLRDLDEYTNNKYQMTANFMPWLTLTAFPVVEVSVSGGQLSFTQTPVSPFMPRYDDAQWFLTVPVLFENSSVPEVYNFSSSTATFDTASTGSFIANPEHTGYYVVNYSSDDWSSVLALAAESSYDPVQRKLIAQDVFILGRMSHVTVNQAIATLQAFSNIQESDLWSEILPRYYQIAVALQNQSGYSTAVADPVWSALSGLVQYVTQSSNSTSEFAQFESMILFWDVYYGDESLAMSLLSAFESGAEIPGAQLDATYWAVGIYGDSDDYNDLVGIYQSSSPGSSSYAAAVLGLSASTVVTMCDESLSMFAMDSRLTESDKLSNAGQMFRYNPVCRSNAWESVKLFSEALLHEEGSTAASDVLNTIAGVFTSSDEFVELQRFLDLNGQYFTSEQIHDTLVQVEVNMNILEINLGVL